MKRLFATLLSLMLFATVTMAQSVDELTKKKVEGMESVVTLTQDQKSAVVAAFKENSECLVANKKLKGSPEYQVAMKASYETLQKKIKATLTPEQFQTWKKYNAEMNAANKNKAK